MMVGDSANGTWTPDDSGTVLGVLVPEVGFTLGKIRGSSGQLARTTGPGTGSGTGISGLRSPTARPLASLLLWLSLCWRLLHQLSYCSHSIVLAKLT